MINYTDLFNKFKEYISTDELVKTPEITKNIKSFFTSEFSDYFVAPNDKEKEFLVDIFVSTANPRKILDSNQKEIFKAILAVESELGGEGGGAPGCLKNNVHEDFVKLLVINSDYKILIFTSLAYSTEMNHIESRVSELEQLYELANHKSTILLIHLEAIPQKSKSNNPTNPRINLKKESINGFILSSGCNFQCITK